MDVTALLGIQRIDIMLDQARHALEHLAEREHHGRCQADLSHLRSQRDDLRREQQIQESELSGVESETTDVDAHRRRLEAQLKTVIAPREAEALQHEIQTLELKRSALDDRGLELLESSSHIDETLAALAEREEEAARAESAARADLDRAIAAMELEIERLALRRAEAVSLADARDLEEYERRRMQFGGVAVAEIAKGVCGGCHMDISVSELDALKRLPADAVAECPNCSRILVR